MSKQTKIESPILPEDISKNEIGAVDAPPTPQGDSTVSLNFDDVRRNAEGVRLNKDGTPRKKNKRRGEGVPGDNAAGNGPIVGGFTDAQVTAAFKGVHSIIALATNFSGWFLSDDEAACFVPSSTLALNQTFPQVAQSKWGAISLASLTYLAVIVGKTLIYLQYKNSIVHAEPVPPPAKPTDAA